MTSILEALQPHPEDRLHLRMHRARSVILTSQELVEIRAAQRTFEGAYMRTALSQFSLALVILKIFTSEFYAIGALLACYGAAVLLVAVYRRYEGNRQFFDSWEEESASTSADENTEAETEGEAEADHGGIEMRGRAIRRKTRPGPGAVGRLRRTGTVMVKKRRFRTSGNSVGLLVVLSLVGYVALMVLLWRIGS